MSPDTAKAVCWNVRSAFRAVTVVRDEVRFDATRFATAATQTRAWDVFGAVIAKEKCQSCMGKQCGWDLGNTYVPIETESFKEQSRPGRVITVTDSSCAARFASASRACA